LGEPLPGIRPDFLPLCQDCGAVLGVFIMKEPGCVMGLVYAVLDMKRLSKDKKKQK